MFLCVVLEKEPIFPIFVVIFPHVLFAQLGIQNVYLWSYYLTSEMFILYLE